MPERLPEHERHHSVSVSIRGDHLSYMRDRGLSPSDLIREAIEFERIRDFSRATVGPLTMLMLSFLVVVLSLVLLPGSARLLSLGFGGGCFLLSLALLAWTFWRQLRLYRYHQR